MAAKKCMRLWVWAKAYSHQAKARQNENVLSCLSGILVIFASCSLILIAFGVAFAWC